MVFYKYILPSVYAIDHRAPRPKVTEAELYININYRISDKSNVILTDLRSGSIYIILFLNNNSRSCKFIQLFKCCVSFDTFNQ